MFESSSYLESARKKGRVRATLPNEREQLCDIGLLVTEIVFEIGPRVRPNVIHLQLPADEVLISVDPLQIHSLIAALVEEVVHASQVPTKVAVSIVQEQERVEIVINDLRPLSAHFLIPLPTPSLSASPIEPSTL